MAGDGRYEPLPRWGHTSVTIGDRIYMWGGRTDDFSESNRKQLSSKLEVFNLVDEYWEQKKTKGTPPLGLYNNAFTVIGRNLYIYGGWDGHAAHNSLHKLNVDTLTWTEMQSGEADELPMKMSGCGLVACGTERLVLFGGYGLPSTKSKPKGKRVNFVTTSSKSSKSITPTTNATLSQSQSSADEGDMLGVTAKSGSDSEGVTAKSGSDGEGVNAKSCSDSEEVNVKNGEGVNAKSGGDGQGVTAKSSEGATAKSGSDGEGDDGVEADLVLSNEGAEDASGVDGGVSGEGESGAEEIVKLDLAVPPAVEDDEEEEDDEDVLALIDKQWTNELKLYDLQNGCWSSPEVGGDCPPPCVDFSFDCIDGRLAVLFGGYRPESGASSGTYVLNMETWNWTKLGDSESSKGRGEWPIGRDGHASCVLSEVPRPQILVSGGWDKENRLLNDTWILDIQRRLWTKFTLPESVGPRLWHRVVSYNYSPKLRQLLFFGGCPGAPMDPSAGAWAKLASTALVEIGQVKKSQDANHFRRYNSPNHYRQSFKSYSGGRGERVEEEWVVVDSVSLALMGEGPRRMKEKLLLAEHRAIQAETQAQRAETIAKEALSKLETIMSRLEKGAYTSLSQPPLFNSDPMPRIPKPEGTIADRESDQRGDSKPFWVIPRSKVELTDEEIGRGKWSVVKVAKYKDEKVAARCLYNQIVSEENQQLFMDCIEMVVKIRHPNILSLIGAVMEGEPIIITELMPTNLKKVIEKGKLYNYQIATIALDVANALKFLHTTRPHPVVHGDLTTTGVLLHKESGNQWRAKLYDFMTAEFFHRVITTSDSESDTSAFTSPARSVTPRVTPPPMSHRKLSGSDLSLNNRRASRKQSVVAPDMLDMSNLTTQRDVYTFGLLLVEMCTGTPPLGISLQFLIESITWNEMTAMVKLCTEFEPSKRPTMEFVVRKLKDIHHATVSRPSKMTLNVV